MPTAKAEPMVFPGEVLVKDIDRKCDDWTQYSRAWDLMFLLYQGGVNIEAAAEQFLTKRPKELSDVYQKRVEMFSYQNHVGGGIDWYLAALFETAPRIEPAFDADFIQKNLPKPVPPAPPVKPNPPNPDGTVTPPAVMTPPKPASATPPPDPFSQLSKDQIQFYDDFEQDCDRAGHSAVHQWREHFKNLLLFGRSAVLVDLPTKGEYLNRDEEKKAGATDPFVVVYDPRQIINYSRDDRGNLDWIIFSARVTKSEPFKRALVFDRWYYFDRTQFAVYEREVPENEQALPDTATALLQSFGPHAMTDEEKVPVVYSELPEGLWLMNRAFSPAKNHLNTDNVLSWALYMAALAMPVIKSDSEIKITLSEAGFIRIPKDAEYAWSEPEGKSFGHLADRSHSLVEEIFRSLYLIAQARTTGATPAAQSGVSKQQDMTAPKKVLNLFGDTIRQMVQTVYDMVSKARGDDIDWDVRGLDFPEDPPDAEIDMVAAALSLDIPSDTFEKELFKKASAAVLRDANPALLQRISAEIDSAPAKADRDLMALQQKASQLVQGSEMKTEFPKGL